MDGYGLDHGNNATSATKAKVTCGAKDHETFKPKCATRKRHAKNSIRLLMDIIDAHRHAIARTRVARRLGRALKDHAFGRDCELHAARTNTARNSDGARTHTHGRDTLLRVIRLGNAHKRIQLDEPPTLAREGCILPPLATLPQFQKWSPMTTACRGEMSPGIGRIQIETACGCTDIAMPPHGAQERPRPIVEPKHGGVIRRLET